MTAYVALLRAVNVGGRKLIMKDLKAIGEELGLASPRTFIASGNLLFASRATVAELREMIEARVGQHMRADVSVLIRTAKEMADVAAANPFAELPGSKVAAIFLNQAPSHNALESAGGIIDERLALGRREIYVAYPSGMGRSKLRLPAAAAGTARNINSVAKMAELAREME
ncbi:MAG: DUF1697 domain-containing protein [Sphingomicrobium sp.]